MASTCVVHTPVKTPVSKKAQCDRFIPNRSAMDIDVAHYNVMKENETGGRGGGNGMGANEILSPSREEYNKQLAHNLLSDANGAAASESKILAFKNKAPAPPLGFENPMRSVYSANAPGGASIKSRRQVRHIPQAPERILDAPELLDDYYLNLLDWSCNNVVSVALGSTVYLWNAESGDIQQLTQMRDEDDYVTSLQWAADGRHIAVGTNSAETQIWDAERLRQVRTLRGHAARVSSIAWNNATLSTGGRDQNILNHDVRVREHHISTLRGHDQEVCGLKWSPNGLQLASGGNDNLLNIWDASAMGGSRRNIGAEIEPLHRIDAHQAAVKALAWCPFQGNLLASGGGTADRCIKFWNTNTGAMLNSIDTHSQVCSLQWNRHEREILSSHGFSQNQLCLWKYPTMVKVRIASHRIASHCIASPKTKTQYKHKLTDVYVYVYAECMFICEIQLRVREAADLTHTMKMPCTSTDASMAIPHAHVQCVPSDGGIHWSLGARTPHGTESRWIFGGVGRCR